MTSISQLARTHTRRFHRLRGLAAFLATFGCAVGVARSAIPSRFATGAGAVQSAVDAGSANSDDSAPRLNGAPAPRGGTRRAVPTTGPSLRDEHGSGESREENGASPRDRDDLIPPSFVPPPPFHPPRAR